MFKINKFILKYSILLHYYIDCSELGTPSIDFILQAIKSHILKEYIRW